MIICPICDSQSNSEKIYKPRGTLVDMEVFMCHECSHIFSTKKSKASKPTSDNIQAKIQKISCDADYTEVRVGKQQMTDKDFDRLVNYSIKNPDFVIKDVLDTCSARGHFIEKVKNYWGDDVNSDAIEPDPYMAVKYVDSDNFKVFIGELENYEIKKKFDVVYSCHSLEHYKNPIKVFSFASKVINKNGLFIINVPNIMTLDTYQGFDEYFYDYHLQYFCPNTLTLLSQKMGFMAEEIYESGSDLVIFFRKRTVLDYNNNKGELQKNKRTLVDNYIKRVQAVQKNLPSISLYIKKYIAGYDNVVFCGAGRVLDSIVKYGSLDISKDKIVLMDNFLSNGTSELYGKKVIKFDDVNVAENTAWIIFANSSSTALVNIISQKYKDANIISLADIQEKYV